MRSINSLEWHTGHTDTGLKSVSFNNALLVKLARHAVKIVLYIPYQLNRYLDSLDTAPNAYRKQLHTSYSGKQDARHQHIPSRVWQRRSALITVMAEEQEAATKAARL